MLNYIKIELKPQESKLNETMNFLTITSPTLYAILHVAARTLPPFPPLSEKHLMAANKPALMKDQKAP